MSNQTGNSAVWRFYIWLLLLIVAIQSPVFFLNRTLIPMAPAHGVLQPTPFGYQGPLPESNLYCDPAGSFNVSFAFDAFTVRALRQGSLPFWNPYQGLGQPFLANALSAVLYPLNLLHLIMSPAWWDLVYLLNWLLAGWFLFLYLRYLGLEAPVAFLAGAAIMVSGSFRIYLALREVPAVAAWFPLLLYAVERTVHEPAWRWRHGVLALGIYMSVTAGQPEVTFLSLFVVLVYALVRLLAVKEQKWRAFLALAPGSLGGLLLSAPLWVNFSAYAFPAYSFHMPGCGAGLMHLGYKYLAAYLFPYLYGFIHESHLGEVSGRAFWLHNPGWVPALLAFLAFASLGELLRKTDKGLIFFVILALLSAAKFAGAPGINYLGELPLFNRVIFPRYGGFLLTFALAGMAAYGIRRLAQLEPPRWLPWLSGWTLLALCLLTLGLQAVWPGLKTAGWGSATVKKTLTFAALGLAWALTAPLALYWVRRRRPEDHQLFYLMAVLGILLQGMAYLPQGFSYGTTRTLITLCLVVYLISVVVVSSPGRTFKPAVLMTYGFAVLALIPLVFTLTNFHGLPQRYDPLTRPLYLKQLLTLQEQGLYRSYSFDAVPQPNFAMPFGLSSLGNIDPLCPLEAQKFITTYVDRGASAIWLAGNLTAGRDPRFEAGAELLTNLRYYSLLAVRYLVGQENEPLNVPFHARHPFHSGISMVPVSLATPLTMKIVCPEEALARVDVFLSTYRKQNPGKVSLQILASDGSLLAAAQSPGEKVRDNSFQKFVFPMVQGLQGREIHLRLSFTPAAPGSNIAAWVKPGKPELGFVCHLYRQASTSMDFPLVYEDPETGVRVWENPGALPRLFLAPEARVVSTWQEALARLQDTPDLSRQVWLTEDPALTTAWPRERKTGKVVALRVEPNEVQATFAAPTPGILTLTDSFSPGWRAALNGREVPVLEVDGVFRGVRLTAPGIYEVRFWYRPPYWTLSLVLAFLGLLLTSGATWLGLRRQLRASPTAETGMKG
jgi:hypothetical protein